MGVGGQRHTTADLPPGKNAVRIEQEVKWAPGPVWMRTEMDTGSRYNHKYEFNIVQTVH
jgi:hypothetical protein